MFILKCSSLLLPCYLYIYSLFYVLLLCEINSIQFDACARGYVFICYYWGWGDLQLLGMLKDYCFPVGHLCVGVGEFHHIT